MGKLSIVGFGPGNISGMTIGAKNTIEEADLIVGFSTYVNLVKEIFPNANYIDTGMGKEKERVEIAINEASKGKNVALICSGDSSLYGMAALAIEMSQIQEKEVDITAVPGVTSALSGGALLGAVIGNDMCTISLSDYHTSFDAIIKRAKLAAEGDFVITLYNPVSKRRPEGLRKVCQALLEILPPNRICGIARNIGRKEEETKIMTLEELKDYKGDMFTTVFIGNSCSKNINGKLITGRGYEL